jgi:hypothetical protein
MKSAKVCLRLPERCQGCGGPKPRLGWSEIELTEWRRLGPGKTGVHLVWVADLLVCRRCARARLKPGPMTRRRATRRRSASPQTPP